MQRTVWSRHVPGWDHTGPFPAFQSHHVPPRPKKAPRQGLKVMCAMTECFTTYGNCQNGVTQKATHGQFSKITPRKRHGEIRP